IQYLMTALSGYGTQQPAPWHALYVYLIAIRQSIRGRARWYGLLMGARWLPNQTITPLGYGTHRQANSSTRSMRSIRSEKQRRSINEINEIFITRTWHGLLT